DGVLAMDMVDHEPVPDRPEREVRAVWQGECRYTLATAIRPLGPDLAEGRHVYRIHHGEALVRTDTLERLHHFHRPPEVAADLTAVGLVEDPVARDATDPLADMGTLIARHAP